jgi:hypothetical protein
VITITITIRRPVDLFLAGPTKRGIAVEAVLIIKFSERLANGMSALGHSATSVRRAACL